MERSPSRASTCFAWARRERGQKRVPLPPARITGRKSIELGMENPSYSTEGRFAQSRRGFHEATVSQLTKRNPGNLGLCLIAARRVLLCKTSEEVAHAAGALVDVLFRDRVGEADMFLSAEGFAGNGDDVALVQQARGQFRCRVNTALAKKGGDVRVDVKRSLGLGAGDAGNLGQLLEHVVAQLDEFGAELRDAVLRTGQCSGGSLLHEAGRVRSLLRLQLAEVGDHRFGRERKTSTPSSHGIGLGERAEDYDVLLGPIEGAARDGLARIVEVHVALVEQKVDAPIVREMDDALEILRGDDGAGGIRRRIENDGLGARGDGRLDGVGGNAEVIGLAGLEEDDLAAGVLNDVFEANPVGDGQDDFVAVIDEDLDGIEERVLAAGGENGFVNRVIGAEVACVTLDDGLAHVGNARDDRIASEIGLDSDDSRVFDVARRGEMGLARAKVNQVDALGAELGGLGGNGHGGRNFNAADAIGKGLGGGSNGHDSFIFTDFAVCIQFPLNLWRFALSARRPWRYRWSFMRGAASLLIRLRAW